MSQAVPTRTDLPRSVASSSERIRRLELRLRQTVEQEVPSEIAPTAFDEPDTFTQWIQRGGSYWSGGNHLTLNRERSWAVAFGPLARHLWAQESTGVGSAEFNRQVRNLRQAVGLLPTMQDIARIDIYTGHAAGVLKMLTGVEHSEFPLSSTARWNSHGSRSRITPIGLPTDAATDDYLTWHPPGTVFDTCGSCAGLPCGPGLACGVGQPQAFNGRAQWIWSTAAVGNAWVDCRVARDFNCNTVGTPTYGFLYCGRCSSGSDCFALSPVPCWCATGLVAAGYTTHQASCDFNSDYQPCLSPLPGYPCSGTRDYRPFGPRLVNEYGPFWLNAHLSSACVFCGGVTSNQVNVPPAYVFGIDYDQLHAAGPAHDATPASAAYRPILQNETALPIPSFPPDAWRFAEPYDRVGVIEEPGGGTPQSWFLLRDLIAAEIATGDYPDVLAFYVAQSATFSPTVNAGWREVPLCGSWEGYLAYRRVGAVVEWRGTVTSKHAIVGDNIGIACWLPEDALGLQYDLAPAACFDNCGFTQAWASSPAGAVLVTIAEEAVLDGATDVGHTGTIWVTAADRSPYYQLTSGDPFIARVQTSPSGPVEQVTFDGVSYFGIDLPRSTGTVDWITVPPT